MTHTAPPRSSRRRRPRRRRDAARFSAGGCLDSDRRHPGRGLPHPSTNQGCRCTGTCRARMHTLGCARCAQGLPAYGTGECFVTSRAPRPPSAAPVRAASECESATELRPSHAVQERFGPYTLVSHMHLRSHTTATTLHRSVRGRPAFLRTNFEKLLGFKTRVKTRYTIYFQ